MEKIVRKMRDLSELVMFQHTIFSIPFILVAMVVAAHGWFGWRLLGLGILAATTARSFAMGFNRYVDRDIDRENPRTAGRPSVDGRLDERSMTLFVAVNAALFILTAWLVNDLAFYLSFPILLILASYSLFKRFSAAAHLMLGVCLGLAPMAGAVATVASVPLWALFLSCGVLFWVAGFDLLYALQDMDYDRQKGLHSIPARFGAATTLTLARIFHLLTVLFWALFAFRAGLGPFGTAAVVLAAAMLSYEHLLVSRGLHNINKAFFTVNGYLGIAFAALVTADFI